MNDAIAWQLNGKAPDTLAGALAVATREQQASKLFSPRRMVEEPTNINDLNSEWDANNGKKIH